MASDPAGERNRMVWVDGIGYRRPGPAAALQALGHKVEWTPTDPDPERNKPLQYKDDE